MRAVPRAAKRFTTFYSAFMTTLRGGGIVLSAAAAATLIWLRKLSAQFQSLVSACLLELRHAATRMRAFSSAPSRFRNVALGIAFVCAIAIRSYYLFVQPMRYGEVRTRRRHVRKGLFRTLIDDYTPNNHLLHTFSVYGFAHLAGWTPASIRFPAFLAGISLLTRRTGVTTTHLLPVVILAGTVAQVFMSEAALVFGETGTNNDASHVGAFLTIKADDLIISPLPASYPVRFYLMRAGVSEDQWDVNDRKIARILAIVDKPEPKLSQDELDRAFAQAFKQSYTGDKRSDFQPAAVIYDSKETHVIAMVPRVAGS